MTRTAAPTGATILLRGLTLLPAFVLPFAVPPSPRAAEQPTPALATASAPDACRFLQKSDLEALFPGRTVTPKPPMLSPVYKGPQYNAGCQYVVKLPSPTSTLEVSKFASFTVVQFGEGTDGRNGSIETFANLRYTRLKVAEGDPKGRRKVESIAGIGDEAIQEVSEFQTDIRARKGDLVFVLSLDAYSTQTLPNALALAKQAASRWQEGVGMVAGSGAVATNREVEVPPDTRKSAQAPVDQWPDACALLKEQDVRAVFGDMKLDPVRKVMGTLTSEGREKRVEPLPNPIACHYTASKVLTGGGERKVVTNTIALNVQDMAATPELAARSYQIGKKVADAKTDVPGLGDEASMTVMNRIYIRKGLLNVSVSVGGDTRDRALYDDATQRVNALAKRVAANLP